MAGSCLQVLLELYKKYGDKWLVELLFDDALDTNNWAVRERTLAPLNLISLGSSTGAFPTKPGSTTQYSCDTTDQNTGCMVAMQASRYESGQDNSPMYDQPGVDSTTVVNQNGNFMKDLNAPGTFQDGLVGPFIQMPLYDVGMTSLLVSEAEALIELAVVLGRTETAAMLRARCDSMRALMQQNLWNEELGVYSNKFSINNSFYPRISPTSFWPLFARAPNDTQAKRMMTDWMMSPKRFCVSPTGDSAGNTDECYWGLPSISADDAAGVSKNDLVWDCFGVDRFGAGCECNPAARPATSTGMYVGLWTCSPVCHGRTLFSAGLLARICVGPTVDPHLLVAARVGRCRMGPPPCRPRRCPQVPFLYPRRCISMIGTPFAALALSIRVGHSVRSPAT